MEARICLHAVAVILFLFFSFLHFFFLHIFFLSESATVGSMAGRAWLRAELAVDVRTTQSC